MKLKQQRRNQSGAVALFVVIFSTLLMIVITISFIQLMLKDQRQATASDLSQSAYDSAQSGVEDAKRLLLQYEQCQGSTPPTTFNCGQVIAAVESDDCNTVSLGLYNQPPQDSEVLIQQSEGDKALQQAYTCIKISANTPDYKGQVEVNQSNMVPLRGVSEFDTVELSWFTDDDITAASASPTVGFPNTDTQVTLPPVGARWATNNPPLLRTQFMQTGGSFTLADFDTEQPGGRSNAHTLFLYPAAAGANGLSFATDPRRNQSNAPEQARCATSFAVAEYACMVRLTLPTPIDGNTASRNAFLRLSALYNGAHYKVQLFNGATPVEFDRVQPEVDSTGRANDMFRRVKSRIEFKSDFIYPEAAVDIVGDLCKSFTITDQDSGYSNSTTCTP